MKRWVSAAILAILGAPAGAQVEATPGEINLGEILAGPAHSREIILRNMGSRPARVSGLAGSCGCLLPGSAPGSLAPGESRALPLHLRTASLPAGPHAWTLAVSSADDAGGEWTRRCRINATVKRVVELEPALLAISTQRETSVALTVRDRRETPLVVTGWTSTIPGLVVEKAGGMAGETRLMARIPAPGQGRVAGAILLETSDPAHSRLEIPVTVQGRGAQSAQASPESLSLSGKAGTAMSRLVRISASGDAPVRIAEVSVEGISASMRHAPGPGRHATLRVETTLPAGSATGSVRVRIEGLDQPVMIPVMVEGS
ncbi:MAG: hypothetical protein ACKO9Z_12825 [Planctomycetota bacterium]